MLWFGVNEYTLHDSISASTSMDDRIIVVMVSSFADLCDLCGKNHLTLPRGTWKGGVVASRDSACPSPASQRALLQTPTRSSFFSNPLWLTKTTVTHTETLGNAIGLKEPNTVLIMSSMAYNSAAGLSGMLKEGTRHMQEYGDDGSVVMRNIDACLQLSRQMLTSSLGPQGRCKLVVNHLQKIIVTADCAAILKEVQIQHPAASLLSMTVQKQKTECGDATNFCLSFAGELLWQTALLIQKMTWQQTAPEIIAGFQHSLKLCLEEFFPQTVAVTIADMDKKENLMKIITPVWQSKQYGTETSMASLVADACMLVYPEGSKGSFPAASIRTVPILGAGVQQSVLIEGYVATRGLQSVKKSASNCKIAVFASGIEASSTEAKGTVVMKTAEDLMTYNKSEELKMQEIIQGLSDAGIQVVVSGGAVSDMAMHFIDKYNLVCLRVSSKWELRRLCQAVGATALVRLGTPMPEEMGFAETVKQQELGDRTVTVFANSTGESKLATIVLRAFTRTLLADLERAVDDGVQVIAQAVKDCNRNGVARLCYGGGCSEMALSVRLQQAAQKVPGLQQYAMQAFAQALWVVPRTLAENAGHKATITLAHLQAAHSTSVSDGSDGAICDVGIDIEEDSANGVCGMAEGGVLDLVATKQSALRLAVDTVTTILKIDQIIMSKQAGGPNPSGP